MIQDFLLLTIQENYVQEKTKVTESDNYKKLCSKENNNWI